MMVFTISYGRFGDYTDVIVPFLAISLIVFNWKVFYRDDTEVTSSFFLIDRVRSVRFAQVYFIGFTVVFLVLSLAGPFLISAFIGLIIAIVLTIFNLIFLLINFLLGYFGVSFGLLSYDLALGISEFLIDSLVNLADISVFQVFLWSFLIFVPIISASFVLGRYIEDKLTGYTAIYQFFLIIGGLTYAWGFLDPMFIGQDFMSILVFTELIIVPIVAYMVVTLTFNRKEEDDSYNLPEIHSFNKLILTLLMLLNTIFVIFLSFLWFFEGLEYLVGNTNFLFVIPMIIFHGIVILYSVLMFFWMNLGDFPVDIRIFEIEYREELLEKAREFREME